MCIYVAWLNFYSFNRKWLKLLWLEVAYNLKYHRNKKVHNIQYWRQEISLGQILLMTTANDEFARDHKTYTDL